MSNTAFHNHMLVTFSPPDTTTFLPIERGVEDFPLPELHSEESISTTVGVNEVNDRKDELMRLMDELNKYRSANFFDQYIELMNLTPLRDDEIKAEMVAETVQNFVIPYIETMFRLKQEIETSCQKMQFVYSRVMEEAKRFESKPSELKSGREELDKLYRNEMLLIDRLERCKKKQKKLQLRMTKVLKVGLKRDGNA